MPLKYVLKPFLRSLILNETYNTDKHFLINNAHKYQIKQLFSQCDAETHFYSKPVINLSKSTAIGPNIFLTFLLIGDKCLQIVKFSMKLWSNS